MGVLLWFFGVHVVKLTFSSYHCTMSAGGRQLYMQDQDIRRTNLYLDDGSIEEQEERAHFPYEVLTGSPPFTARGTICYNVY